MTEAVICPLWQTPQGCRRGKRCPLLHPGGSSPAEDRFRTAVHSAMQARLASSILSVDRCFWHSKQAGAIQIRFKGATLPTRRALATASSKQVEIDGATYYPAAQTPEGAELDGSGSVIFYHGTSFSNAIQIVMSGHIHHGERHYPQGVYSVLKEDATAAYNMGAVFMFRSCGFFLSAAASKALARQPDPVVPPGTIAKMARSQTEFVRNMESIVLLGAIFPADLLSSELGIDRNPAMLPRAPEAAPPSQRSRPYAGQSGHRWPNPPHPSSWAEGGWGSGSWSNNSLDRNWSSWSSDTWDANWSSGWEGGRWTSSGFPASRSSAPASSHAWSSSAWGTGAEGSNVVIPRSDAEASNPGFMTARRLGCTVRKCFRGS